MAFFFRLLLLPVMWVHNFSYRLIGILAIYANRGLHPKHHIEKYYEFYQNNLSPSDTVLDIGCGNGALSYQMAKKCKHVTGIDISKKNITDAKSRHQRDNISYVIGDATNFSFYEKYSAIALSNVLEHIQNCVAFLRSIKQYAPIILIRVPLITRDWLAVYKKEIGVEYRLDKTHFTEYTEEDFCHETQAAGLTIQSSYSKFGELYAVVIHS